MIGSRRGVSLLAFLLAFSVHAPARAAASGNDSACGMTLLAAANIEMNCASVTITHTGGQCWTNNEGTFNEHYHCDVTTYHASGNALAWMNEGAFTISVSGSAGWRSTGCAWSQPERVAWSSGGGNSRTLQVRCNPVDMYWGECGHGSAARVTMTFEGSFAPRTLQARAEAGFFHCIPQ